MANSIIYGKYPVKNSLLAKRLPNRVLLNKDHPDQEIILQCKKLNVPYQLVDNKELDRLSEYHNHQGCLASLKEFEFSKLEEIIKNDDSNHIIVVLDGIQDPVNFGSIIRTSVAFSVDGIIIADKNQVSVTPTVRKIATGAEELVSICKVPSLINAVKELKRNNYWIVSSAGEGETSYTDIDYKGKFVIVIGSEGDGVSKLLRKVSDYVASIPLHGKVKALNASIAAAIFLAKVSESQTKE